MSARIFISSPDVGQLEEDAVVAAMRSGWVAPLGPDVDAFERGMAQQVGVSHGVALSSGTAALHLGLLTLGVGPGTVVVTSALTFAATANAIVYTGAEPYFVDALAATGNMDPDLLRKGLEELRAAGDTVSAILPVDLMGKAADYTRVLAIAAEFGVPVLSDAAESLGATHAGRAAGSFGRASIVSFNGNKIMTTSSGGMLLTNDAEFAHHVRYLASQARQPLVHYEHNDIGYNYRLSNLLAALGRAQLSRLAEMIERRWQMRRLYKELFIGLDGVEVFGLQDDDADNGWLTSVLIDRARAGWAPKDLAAHLAEDNIESRPFWKPMHLQPVFARSRGLISGESERLFERGLSLPSGSALTEAQRERVASKIVEFLAKR